MALALDMSTDSDSGGEVTRTRDTIEVTSTLEIRIDDSFLDFFWMLHIFVNLIEIACSSLSAECFVEFLVLSHVVLSSLNSAHLWFNFYY